MRSAWDYISSHIPPPEVEEVESIIGKKLIDNNKILFNELCAMKDIVSGFLTEEFNIGFKIMDNERKLNDNLFITSPKKSPGKSDCSFSATIELLESRKDSFCISRIGQVAIEVAEILQNENEEMEAEILLLQSAMDAEVDLQSRCSTPKYSQSEYSSLNHSKSLLAPSTSTGLGVSDMTMSMSKMITPGRIRASSKIKMQDVPKNVSKSSGAPIATSCSLSSLTTMPSTSHTTRTFSSRCRIRNKIQDARDERFLSDIDDLTS